MCLADMASNTENAQLTQQKFMSVKDVMHISHAVEGACEK